MAVKHISVAVIRNFLKIYTLWRTFKCPLGNETFQEKMFGLIGHQNVSASYCNIDETDKT